MNAPKIVVRNLVKEFPPKRSGESALRVINGLDVTIADHELVCILGSSGCGKSTFLNILAGLDRAYEGEVTIGGQRMTGGKPPVRVAYLFQEPRLLPWLTAERNVDFALTTCKVPRARWGELKERYLALTGLASFRNYYPHQLSGGMCQRLALVRALCVEPDIMLMDEPFSGLDELTARRLRMDLLDIWVETRKTILFVTHNAYEASFLADRILVMSRGEIREEIPVRVERPRDYDDPAIFDINRGVVKIFLETVSGGAEPQQNEAAAKPGRAAAG